MAILNRDGLTVCSCGVKTLSVKTPTRQASLLSTGSHGSKYNTLKSI